MKRKDFINRIAAFAFLGIPVISLTSSCSKEETPAPTSNNNNTNNQTQEDCLANGTNTSIGSNHGHTLTVSKDDVNAAVEKTYSIKGSSAHDHSVTISSAQFASLKNDNNSITVSSTSSSGHSHSVTVTCA
ncbi:MAG: hypothetical protein KDC79_00170 [Cyclobacteriaceae bacterium]|nr:hypothetical protein [Cyclobacteriaceae bacterium]